MNDMMVSLPCSSCAAFAVWNHPARSFEMKPSLRFCQRDQLLPRQLRSIMKRIPCLITDLGYDESFVSVKVQLSKTGYLKR